MLLLADCGFYSFALWRKAIATGADLHWRAKTGLRPQQLQSLDDDSWLAQIRPAGDHSAEPITVRVIDYTVDDGRDKPQVVPAVHHDPGPGVGLGHRAGRGLRPAVGDRARPG